ncbi:MAG: sigma factor [Candidatus Micrarchaeota archaeon]
MFLQKCFMQPVPKFKYTATSLPEDEAASKLMASARERVLQEKKAEIDAATIKLKKTLEESLKSNKTSLSTKAIRLRLKSDSVIRQHVLLDFLRRDAAFVEARNDILVRHTKRGLPKIAAASFFKHFPRSEFLERSLNFDDLLSKANERIVSAAETFDHTKGPFESFAINVIWNGLFDDFRRGPFSGTRAPLQRMTALQNDNSLHLTDFNEEKYAGLVKNTPESIWRKKRTRELFQELLVDALPGKQNLRRRQIFKDFLLGEYSYGERSELTKKYKLSEAAMNQIIYYCRKALLAKMSEPKYADLKESVLRLRNRKN